MASCLHYEALSPELVQISKNQINTDGSQGTLRTHGTGLEHLILASSAELEEVNWQRSHRPHE